MLYQMYETQRSLVEPFADFALAAAKLYSNPSSPFSQAPLSQRISAGFELFYRLGKDYEKPQFGIPSVKVGDITVNIMERVEIGNRDHRIIERGGHVCDTHGDILLLFLPKNFFLSSSFCHCLI